MIPTAVEAIKRARSIVILCHKNPDGDAIGSLLALGIGLQSIGKDVFMVSPDGVPERYISLYGAGMIVRHLDRKVDLAIAVDCSNKEILGSGFKIFRRAKVGLEIDHHDFRRPFGDIQLVDPKAPAVGELIYKILNRLKVDITKDIAEGLLTSIIIETDSFRLPNVDPYIFRICGEMVKKGVDFYKLVDIIFWSKTKQQVLLTGVCLSRTKFLMDGRIAWSIIRKKDFQRFGGRDEDIDPVADELRRIRDVKIVVLFREKGDNMLRVSLRSKDKINVASIAERYGGGGHFDVAGCEIPNTKSSIMSLLKNVQGLLAK